MMSYQHLSHLALSSMLFFAQSCGAGTSHKSPAAPVQEASLRQSPEAEKLRIAWEDKVKKQQKIEEAKTVSKGIVREKFEILEGLLKEAPPEVVNAELRRLQTSPQSYSEMSDYEQTFIQLFVDKYIKQNARDELVELLAAKCPRYVGYAPLEVALTSRQSTDNLLLLFEAFERSNNDDSKKMIVRILGDVFKKLRRDNADDQAFLRASRQWYQANRARLVINPRYQPNSTWPDGQDFFLGG